MKRLLIVDDEKDLVELYEEILLSDETEPKYIIDSAENGFEALQFLYKHHYDLAISDFRMPQLTGLELVQKTRKIQNNNCTLPFIILSGYAHEFSKRANPREFRNIYILEKPVTPLRLKRAVESWLSKGEVFQQILRAK